MNTILDILALRKPILDYTSPPICGLFFSGSSSGSFSFVADSVVPERSGIAAPSNPAITMSPTSTGCPLVSFSAPRGQLGFLIYEESSPGSGQYGLISNTIPPASIGVLTPGHYFTAPVDQFGVEGPHSGPTPVTGGSYTPVPIVTSPTAVSYNVYNGTTLVWSGVNPSRDAFEGCNCANYKVQALSLEGTALSQPVFACTPTQLAVTPSSMIFSGVALGTSASQSFTLTNVCPIQIVGAASLNLTDHMITAGQTYNLAPGQSILVTITFSPSTVENLNGAISFSGAQPLNATIQSSSVCASGTVYPPITPAGTLGIFRMGDPSARVGWLEQFAGSLYEVSLVNNTVINTFTSGFVSHFDIRYNPKFGTKGGLVLAKLSGSPQAQVFDLAALTFTTPVGIFTTGGDFGTTAVRPSDGTIVIVGNGTTALQVLDKNLNNILSNTYAGKSFGGVAWSTALGKFVIGEQVANNKYWILDVDNLGAGLVPCAIAGPGQNVIQEVPGLNYLFISGTTGSYFINPLTNTILNFNGLLTNALTVTYSPCNGQIYVGSGGGLVRVDPNTWATTNLGPGGQAVSAGVIFDLLGNVKFNCDRALGEIFTVIT